MKLCRNLLIPILVCCLGLVQGCETSPKSSQDELGPEFTTGMPLEPGYANQIGYSTRWLRSLSLAKAQSIYSAEILGDLILVIERPSNVVTAIKLSDGSLAWKAIVGSRFENLFGAVATDEHVFVNTANRMFRLDRGTGQLLDVADLDHAVAQGPTLIGTRAIFGAINGIAFAHDVNDGYSKWAYALPGKIVAAPLQDGLQVFIADATGHYAMLEADDGELLWRGSAYGPITADPVLDRSFIIIASEDQSLYSIVSSTGKWRWDPYRSESPLVDSPIIVGRSIFLHEPGTGMVSIDYNTGQPNWTYPTPVIPVIQANDALLAYNQDGVVALNPQTGKVLGEAPTEPLFSVLTTPEGALILVTESGRLHRVDPH